MKGILLFVVLFGPLSGLAAVGGDSAIPYGDNPAAGHYVQVGDAKLYYETYGSGPPLVLIHGGLFGYIDEFSGIIPELSRRHTVIAIALRGHGKSELGRQPLSNDLLSEDAATIIRHVTNEPVDLVGFSIGAYASYLLAVNHPELVHKLVAMGGPVSGPQASTGEQASNPYTDPDALEKQLPPQFIERRNRIYPDRTRWNQLVIAMGRAEANGSGVTKEKLRLIRSPTLILAGDRDNYSTPDRYAEDYQQLSHGELGIVPRCGHTVVSCDPKLTVEMIEQFIEK
jgi:pimeloyl-ACP methyl ester carboxylesterase